MIFYLHVTISDAKERKEVRKEKSNFLTHISSSEAHIFPGYNRKVKTDSQKVG